MTEVRVLYLMGAVIQFYSVDIGRLLTTGDRAPFRSLRNSSVKLSALKECSLNKIVYTYTCIKNMYLSYTCIEFYIE